MAEPLKRRKTCGYCLGDGCPLCYIEGEGWEEDDLEFEDFI